jgi:thioredoxin-related protein
MKIHRIFILFLITFTSAAHFCVAGNGINSTISPKTAKFTPKSGEIEWLTIEEASKRNKKNPRKIIVDVYTSWCGWCKRMDKVTFGDPKVIEMVNKDFYAVKFNAESPDNVIFKDEVFRFNPDRKANDLAVKWLNGEMGYPTIVYLNEKLETIKSWGGYVGPDEYPTVLEYIKSGSYKKRTFEEFVKKQ